MRHVVLVLGLPALLAAQAPQTPSPERILINPGRLIDGRADQAQTNMRMVAGSGDPLRDITEPQRVKIVLKDGTVYLSQ
jgi:hypothetical protein